MSTVEKPAKAKKKRPKGSEHTRNYVFDCDEPHEGLVTVREQLRLAGIYRNRLVEIEHQRRDEVFTLLRQMAPDFADAEVAHEAARERVDIADAAIKASRQQARKRVKATPEQAAEFAAAKKARSVAAKALTAIKKATFDREDIQAALEAVGEANGVAKRDARKHSQLYWGTYLVVEEAAKNFGKKAPPKFKSRKGQGTLGLQFQNGLDTAQIQAGRAYLFQVEIPDRLVERLAVVGKARQSHGKAILRMRVASTNKKKPIYTAVKFVMHRPLPTGKIKWVYLMMKRTASTERWSVMFAIDLNPPPVRLPATEPLVAVHLGFRTLPDGRLRVATVLTPDGRTSELCLEAAEYQTLQRNAEIQSNRDKLFNAARSELVRWLKDPGVWVPEWLTERTATLHAWRSPARLASLVSYWRGYWDGEIWVSNRFQGDETIFPQLESWRKDDKQDWLQTAHSTTKQARRRANFYRTFAKRLATRYQKAVLAAVKWSELFKEPETDKEGPSANIRRRGRLAAPGELTQYLTERFGKGEIVSVAAANITTHCYQCGLELDGDREDRILHCPTHGPIDQDYNAVHATLARGQAALLAPPAAPPAGEDPIEE